MFVARKSNHIQEDIKRNWSSWNFGEEGIECTEDELNDYIDSISDSMPLFISGFEIYPDQIEDFEIRELYPNYWVVVDNDNAPGGLSGVNLSSNDLESAILEAEQEIDYYGEGNVFNTEDAKLVYSNDEIHIFEIN